MAPSHSGPCKQKAFLFLKSLTCPYITIIDVQTIVGRRTFFKGKFECQKKIVWLLFGSIFIPLPIQLRRTDSGLERRIYHLSPVEKTWLVSTSISYCLRFISFLRYTLPWLIFLNYVSALMDICVLGITHLIDAELIHEQTKRHHPNNT